MLQVLLRRKHFIPEAIPLSLTALIAGDHCYWLFLPCIFKGLRGAYFNDELGPTVVLAKGLPQDPIVFTMAHELKHHLTDRALPISYCDESNQFNPIEIGAEIFAAELIYPDQDYAADLARMGVARGACTP